MAAIQQIPNGDPDGITADAQDMPYTFIGNDLLLFFIYGHNYVVSSSNRIRRECIVDIGSNLGDPVFRGEYHGKQAHPGQQ
jgi:hypothetical protein